MSISGRVGASAEWHGGGLADHLAALSATRDRGSLCSAACRAAGELLGLDGAWMACRRRGRVGAEAEWLRAGARAQRLGGARLEELLLEASQAGGPVVGTAGRQATRILLACDAFHAMTSDRVYRQAMTVPEAVAELRRCSGSQFHPQVVDALVAVIAASGAESAR